MMTPAANDTPLESGLGLEGVFHAYGRTPVVRGVGLMVPKGELACLLGPSGCGKTTLLRLSAGLEVLQKGWITIGDQLVGNGETGLHIPPEKRGVGLMFQDYALFPHLTVRENIIFGLRRPTAARMDWVTGALGRFGLADMMNAYPHTLSGGQQQRVALLRAIAPQPRVMLLDEPFSGLDVTLRAQVRTETLELVKETGAASLMVTHDPEEAMFMADRIFIMNEGRIIQAGAPKDIYSQPTNAFVASLFGPINRCEGTVEGGRLVTPIGPFPAPGIGEQVMAQVMVRPEAIRVLALGQSHPDGLPARPARVLWARLLGRSIQVRLEVEGSHGQTMTIEARISGDHGGIAEGDQVQISVDPDQAFVFPIT